MKAMIEDVATAAANFETQGMIALFLCLLLLYSALLSLLSSVKTLVKLSLESRERQNQAWQNLIRELAKENPRHEPHSFSWGFGPDHDGSDELPKPAPVRPSPAGIHTAGGRAISGGPAVRDRGGLEDSSGGAEQDA
jgi:hypothetical protein